MPSTRPIFKKVFPLLALLAGLLLLYFEIRRLQTHSLVEEWFWVLVAVFMIALSLAGLLSKPKKKKH